jgi:hypothetical protein
VDFSKRRLALQCLDWLLDVFEQDFLVVLGSLSMRQNGVVGNIIAEKCLELVSLREAQGGKAKTETKVRQTGATQ